MGTEWPKLSCELLGEDFPCPVQRHCLFVFLIALSCIPDVCVAVIVAVLVVAVVVPVAPAAVSGNVVVTQLVVFAAVQAPISTKDTTKIENKFYQNPFLNLIPVNIFISCHLV